MKAVSIRTSILLILILLVSGQTLYPQTFEKVRKISYNAYAKGELHLWAEAESIIEQEYKQKRDSSSLYECLLAQYGYVAFCVNNKIKDKGLVMLQKAYNNADLFLEKYPDDPGALAIRASFVAFEINFKPTKLLSQGGEAVRLINAAYEVDNNNLMVLHGKANQLRFSPGIFGGSIDEAISMYQKIIDKYDTGVLPAENDWIYINTMVVLARSFEKKKMYSDACIVYRKIISVDKDINWITNGYYPACLEKANQGADR